MTLFGRALVALSLLLAATATQAQTPAQLGARRDLLERAQQAALAGDHAQALDLARRSGAILMSASLRGFMAQQEAALGQITAALGDADACVRATERDTAMHNRDAILAQCRELIASLRSRVGRVSVHVPSPPPPGLRVTLAGELLDPALFDVATPVAPGPVHLEASAPGYPTFARDLVVTEGASVEATVQFTTVASGAPIANTSPAPVVASGAPPATPMAAVVAAPRGTPAAQPVNAPRDTTRGIGPIGAVGVVALVAGAVAAGIGAYLYFDTGRAYTQCEMTGCALAMQPRGEETAGIALVWSGIGVGVIGVAALAASVLMAPSRRDAVRAIWIDPRGAVGITGRF